MLRKPIFILFSSIILMLLSIMTGCEKSDYYEDETNDNKTEQTNNSPNNEPSSDDDSGDGGDDSGKGYNEDNGSITKDDTLTVDQFINGNFDGGAFVKGYVVGDCTKSFKYAEFEPPFTHPQALLLADSKGETRKDHLLAVQLKSGTKARIHMNLVDNPEWYGKRIVVFGYRSKYLGMAGLKDLGAYPLYNP